jgi:hypothetical protein
METGVPFRTLSLGEREGAKHRERAVSGKWMLEVLCLAKQPILQNELQDRYEIEVRFQNKLQISPRP